MATKSYFQDVKAGGVTLGGKCHKQASDRELMDELEEILRRLGDAENVIEEFLRRQTEDALPHRAGDLFPKWRK